MIFRRTHEWMSSAFSSSGYVYVQILKQQVSNCFVQTLQCSLVEVILTDSSLIEYCICMYVYTYDCASMFSINTLTTRNVVAIKWNSIFLDRSLCSLPIFIKSKLFTHIMCTYTQLILFSFFWFPFSSLILNNFSLIDTFFTYLKSFVLLLPFWQ